MFDFEYNPQYHFIQSHKPKLLPVNCRNINKIIFKYDNLVFDDPSNRMKIRIHKFKQTIRKNQTSLTSSSCHNTPSNQPYHVFVVMVNDSIILFHHHIKPTEKKEKRKHCIYRKHQSCYYSIIFAFVVRASSADHAAIVLYKSLLQFSLQILLPPNTTCPPNVDVVHWLLYRERKHSQSRLRQKTCWRFSFGCI